MSQWGTISEDPSAGRRVSVSLRSLREEHPSSTISTELERLDETQAIVRAVITLPTGGSASAFGAVAATMPHAVEMAEDRALGRALEALGIGGEVHPPEQRASTAVPQSVEPESAVLREKGPPALSATDVTVEPPPPHPVQSPAIEPVIADDDDPPLEDYSWTAFWQWARKHGYQNKVQVEELIGQSILSLSPAQVRNALRAKTGVD